jgi:SNF2 family DNA or RNA helicase
MKDASPVSWKRLRKQYPWLKQLKKVQRRGVEAASSISGFAALFEQRTGKTWVTVALLCVLRKSLHDVLLVGPLTNLESTWEKTILEKAPWFSVHRNLEEYDKAKKADPTAHRILLLNPEQVTPIRAKLQRRKWDLFVWDEAQRLKNRNSRSSKDAHMIAKSAARRLALTGTPMDLDPKDLWAIMRFVDRSVLGDVWKDFGDYFLEEPKLNVKKLGAIARQKEMLRYQIAKRKSPMKAELMQEFADLIAPNVGRITKEDVGITRANTHDILIDLSEREDRNYRKLEKTMIHKYRGVKVKTPLKITKIGKLQQMTGGFIKDEDGEVHRIGQTKRRAFRRLIEKHAKKGEPIAVFCKFTHEVHMLAELLENMGYPRVSRLWGKVKDAKNDKKRTNMLLAFQRGEIDAMVCQQRTGGVGVDLYRARKFFVYSMGHSFIDFDQMLSRGDYMEQTESADFFFLMVRRSIDTDIITSVRKKKSITDTFYGRLQKGS